MQHPSSPPVAGSRQSSQSWVWLLVLAGLLIMLGLAAMSALALSARLFVVVLGWLLVGGGALQIGGAFLFRGAGGLGAEVFFGALGILLGAILIWAPVTVGSLIALLLVLGLIADAMLEGIRAVLARQPGWIWPVLIALLSLVLGGVIVVNPSLLLLLLGFLVGINLLIRGVVLLLAALEARSLSG